jgi:hypothetical protein
MNEMGYLRAQVADRCSEALKIIFLACPPTPEVMLASKKISSFCPMVDSSLPD